MLTHIFPTDPQRKVQRYLKICLTAQSIHRLLEQNTKLAFFKSLTIKHRPFKLIIYDAILFVQKYIIFKLMLKERRRKIPAFWPQYLLKDWNISAVPGLVPDALNAFCWLDVWHMYKNNHLSVFNHVYFDYVMIMLGDGFIHYNLCNNVLKDILFFACWWGFIIPDCFSNCLFSTSQITDLVTYNLLSDEDKNLSNVLFSAK